MSEKFPQLFFMRHGAYTPSADPQNCTLSEAGVLAQHQISQRLKHDGYLIDSILCSPLPRARQSASILLEYFPVDIEIDEGLDPCFENFEKILTSISKWKHVALVGHDPTLLNLARTLYPKAQLPTGLSKSSALILTQGQPPIYLKVG